MLQLNAVFAELDVALMFVDAIFEVTCLLLNMIHPAMLRINAIGVGHQDRYLLMETLFLCSQAIAMSTGFLVVVFMTLSKL